MDKLLGLMCALLCIWNAEAAITGWAGTFAGGAIAIATKDGSATISLQSSTAVSGATLFTLTATVTSPDTIASYAFEATGNPSTYGTVTKTGSSGVVTLAKALDYATNKQVIFKVLAVDTASTAITATATITVNFGPSTDTAYSFCVADPTALGATIGTASSSVSTATWTLGSGDASKFSITSGVIKAAAKLESSEKSYYTSTLTLTDGTGTSMWPLHVLVDNSCHSSGVAHIVSGVAMIVLTLLACRGI